LPDVIKPETSDPGGNDGDAELGEGAIAPVGDCEPLGADGEAELCRAIDGD
jgi:hypothetical protein